MDGDRARAARAARPDRAAPHLHALSALQHLRPRRHAALRARAGGAPYPARAGQGRIVQRARGGRGDAQRARRDRAARRRAGGLRHAARPAVRARRRRAAAVSRRGRLAASVSQAPADLPAELEEIAAALAVLRELRRGRNRRPIAETIARLLAATRAHAAIAIWPTGEQALANVMRLMDLARRYEARRAVRSFRGFVDELEARAEREESGEAPVVEEGTEGVRIMTVHRAKGLEFPVVLLADLTCNETAGDAHRWVDPASGLCAHEARRPCAARTARARRGGDAPRPRGGDAPALRRRDPRARFAGRARGRQRAAGGMAWPAQSGDLSRAQGLARAARAGAARMSRLRRRQRRRASAQGPAEVARRRAGAASRRRPATIMSCGGTPPGSGWMRARRWAFGSIGC